MSATNLSKAMLFLSRFMGREVTSCPAYFTFSIAAGACPDFTRWAAFNASYKELEIEGFGVSGSYCISFHKSSTF